MAARGLLSRPISMADFDGARGYDRDEFHRRLTLFEENIGRPPYSIEEMDEFVRQLDGVPHWDYLGKGKSGGGGGLLGLLGR